MSEDKQKDQPVAESQETASKPKSNLMKYIIYGVSGLVLVLVVAFGVGFLLKESPQAEADKPIQSSDKVEHAEVNEPHVDDAIDSEENADDELTIDDFDKDAIEKIVDNLAFLDYEPTAEEIADNSDELIKDSLEQMSWIEQQTLEIKNKTAELDKRQRELDKQEMSIDGKIIRIEQAESSRVNQLAKLYDSMDSRSVAKLMMNLDDETIVSILPRMKSKNAAHVLQLLPPQKAAGLSKKMITIAEK